MKRQIEQVIEFHRAMGVPVRSQRQVLIPEAEYYSRYDLAKEELEEYAYACERNLRVDIADAIVDQLYVLLGTAVQHGLGDVLEAMFDEVHRSNMTKLWPDGPHLGRDGKFAKGPDYRPPELAAILDGVPA